MKRVCAGCEKTFDAKSPKYFLCPACAKIAFVDHVCPICGDGMVAGRNKPTCQNCANLAMSAQGGDSVRCNFVMDNGKRCRSWAMRGTYWCRQHQR